MTPARTADSRRADIDGLRALAVVPIVLFHSGFETFSGGFVGVDVFFVISGFLITGLVLRDVERGEFSFRAFYLRRIRRLFPALFVTISATLVAGFFVLSPSHFEGLGKSAAAAALSVSNFLFWWESGYFGEAGIFKPLLHTWSLGVEEQFYLFWPGLIWVVAAFGRRQGWPSDKTALTVIGVLGLASLAMAEAAVDGNRETPFFLMPYRVCEFSLGALCILIRRLGPGSQLLADSAFAIGIALVLYAVFAFTDATRFPGLSAMIPATGAALLIVVGDRSRLRGLLEMAPAVWIGRISYSLYLVHWPVAVFWAYNLDGELAGDDRAVVAILSIALAVVLYHWVERPLRMASSEAPGARPAIMQGTAVGGLLVVSLAGAIVAGRGLPWRVPADIAFLGLDQADLGKPEYGGSLCRGRPCTYGAANAPIGLLVAGDSHGQQYASGLAALLKDKGVGIAGYHDQSCAFFTEDQVRGQGAKDGCEPMKTGLRKAMSGNLTPLFLGQAWFLYRKLQKPDGTTIEFTDETFESYVKASLTTFLAGIEPARPVILATPVPGSAAGKSDVLTCFSRPHVLAALGLAPTEAAATRCIALPRASGRGAELSGWIRDVAKGFSNVVVLDPYEALCDAEKCFSMKDRKYMYSDSTHLSVRGSIFVIDHFREQILAALRSSAMSASH